ncbi:DUF2268 domain-containing protein [Neobacillus sp.]|uniref:DUF2268 domain-containing protein n=1 Tax=Neobacillus sp. TaxID=2675273 RepID=UPI00289AE444|nr:DUF2268 domain-containing protein [Neobacillus sp.]
MGVIRTDEWLHDSYHEPIEICEKLKVHFKGALASEIYEYLTLHGMYHPLRNGNEEVKKLQINKVWEIVEEEKLRLQEVWVGPNIPIFIFPSDKNNRKLKQDFNGKSGLAFKDKLFLFISEDNTEKEIRALFTHEYNHVCRLSKFQKNEEDYVLLDTIILEGLAENAVRERMGDEFLATWTSYYSNEELNKMWKNIVLPNKNVLKNDLKHQNILYGLRFYPKMLGYCVGYYLVKNYLEATNKKSKDLLNIHTDTITQIM